VEWLVEAGVSFSADPAGPLGLHLTREGGHACAASRMLRCTGKAIPTPARARAAPPEHRPARALDAVDVITRATAA